MHHRIVVILIVVALLFLGSRFLGPGFDEAVSRVGTALGIVGLMNPQPTPISVPNKLWPPGNN